MFRFFELENNNLYDIDARRIETSLLVAACNRFGIRNDLSDLAIETLKSQIKPYQLDGLEIHEIFQMQSEQDEELGGGLYWRTFVICRPVIPTQTVRTGVLRSSISM